MSKDVMASGSAEKLEAKSLHQMDEIGKRNILQVALGQALQEFFCGSRLILP